VSSAPALIQLLAGSQRYFIYHQHMTRLSLIDPHDPPLYDEQGRSCIVVDLAMLLGSAVADRPVGRYGVLVGLRRRTVIFLVDRGDMPAAIPSIQPFSKSILRSLAHPWIIGAALDADVPIILLDLRRIAADVVFVGVESLTARRR
jgi:hypothetical protein